MMDSANRMYANRAGDANAIADEFESHVAMVFSRLPVESCCREVFVGRCVRKKSNNIFSSVSSPVREVGRGQVQRPPAYGTH